MGRREEGREKGKKRKGLQDGSVSEDVCFQVWLIVFNPRTHM